MTGATRRSVILVMIACSFGSLVVGQPQQRNAPSSPFEMQTVIDRHAVWLASDGSDGARADLRRITLEGVNRGLRTILSSGVVLRGADLRRADFREARMRGVDLSDARLEQADFRGSNLRWAVFDGADLSGADFRGANLDSSLIRGASVDGARFDGADLRGADLTGARCLRKDQASSATTDEYTTLPAFEDCQ